jgi:hypothetical protein
MKTNKLEQEALLLIRKIEKLMAEQYKLDLAMSIKKGSANKKSKLLNSQVKKS